jgi:cytochrome c nitrite reductase small subunit
MPASKDEAAHGRGEQPHWVSRSLRAGTPGTRLAWLFALLLGVGAGLGVYTFSYAKGLSYFGTDPRACTNCHIMNPEYAAWQKSSHHTAAVCIDCHLPHEFVPKYIAKAENGYRHGKLFTTQTFEEPITVKPAGLAILQSNCERCHADLIHGLAGGAAHDGQGTSSARGEAPPCLHCHWGVGHGERAGLGGPLTAAELGAAPATDQVALEQR